MDRWTGVLRVAALDYSVGTHFKVAASLCVSPASGTLAAPSTNALFFTGDRVHGTGNQVIDELSDSANIARLLVAKLRGRGEAVNVWVLDAATFSGPFAVYREFVPSVDSRGNPTRYDPEGLPASTSIAALLSSSLFFFERKWIIPPSLLIKRRDTIKRKLEERLLHSKKRKSRQET